MQFISMLSPDAGAQSRDCTMSAACLFPSLLLPVSLRSRTTRQLAQRAKSDWWCATPTAGHLANRRKGEPNKATVISEGCPQNGSVPKSPFLQLACKSTREDIMVRHAGAYALAFVAGAALFATAALALGTAADAKAMLEKTVAAIKADKAKTLDQINAGESGFLQGDIYPFCFNLSDGKNVAIANPNAKQLIGRDVRTIKDPTGDAYGQRLYDAAKEGQVGEVSYKFPKPGSDTTPVPKVSFVTAVDGLGCGVGYYK
jgi:hypothetical protein